MIGLDANAHNVCAGSIWRCPFKQLRKDTVSLNAVPLKRLQLWYCNLGLLVIRLMRCLQQMRAAVAVLLPVPEPGYTVSHKQHFAPIPLSSSSSQGTHSADETKLILTMQTYNSDVILNILFTAR